MATAIPPEQQPTLQLLQPMQPSDFKNTYGHVAILEGCVELAGASRLVAYSALRAGAGLVTLLTHNQPVTHSDQPELMHHTVQSFIAQPWSKLPSCLVIGPGLGHTEANLTLAADLSLYAASNSIPIVIDADALPLLICQTDIFNKASIIATPHPGEAAKLLKISTQEVEANRLQAIDNLCDLPINAKANIVWVLKGADPIIAQRGEQQITCEGGVPALAVGGSGDVLSGAIAALIAQTKTLFDAALTGISAHLTAGRILQQWAGRGHFAREIADALPGVLRPPE